MKNKNEIVLSSIILSNYFGIYALIITILSFIDTSSNLFDPLGVILFFIPDFAIIIFYILVLIINILNIYFGYKSFIKNNPTFIVLHLLFFFITLFSYLIINGESSFGPNLSEYAIYIFVFRIIGYIKQRKLSNK